MICTYRIVRFDKSIGNVRNIVPGVALTGHVYLVSLHVEGFHELLQKANELLAELDLVSDVGYTLREANSHWLFHPDHIGQIDLGAS